MAFTYGKPVAFRDEEEKESVQFGDYSKGTYGDPVPLITADRPKPERSIIVRRPDPEELERLRERYNDESALSRTESMLTSEAAGGGVLGLPSKQDLLEQKYPGVREKMQALEDAAWEGQEESSWGEVFGNTLRNILPKFRRQIVGGMRGGDPVTIDDLQRNADIEVGQPGAGTGDISQSIQNRNIAKEWGFEEGSEKVPPGTDPVQAFAGWLQTEEGSAEVQAEAASTPIAMIAQDIWDAETGKIDENAIQVKPQSAKYYAAGILDAGINMGPAMAATVLTKNPSVGAAIMGSQVYGDTYGEMLDRGYSPDQAMSAAVFSAAAETLTERIPLGVLTGNKYKGLKRILAGATAEGIQEPVTEALQIGYDVGILNEDMKMGEAMWRLIDAGIIGFGVGGGMGAGVELLSNVSTPAAKEVIEETDELDVIEEKIVERVKTQEARETLVELKDEKADQIPDEIEQLESQADSEVLGDDRGTSEIDAEAQAEETDISSPSFKAWFGNSKVVKKDGDPLIVYHGTSDSITVFDPSKTVDGGIHFGTKKQANMRAVGRNKNIISVFLKAENLQRSKDLGGNWKRKIQSAKSSGKDGVVYLNRYEGLSVEVIERLDENGLLNKLDGMTDAQFKKAVPEAEDSYIIFNPDHIRSVITGKPLTDASLQKDVRERSNQAINYLADAAEIEPSEDQIKAGNYRKGHVPIKGLDISIENPAGSTRSGTDRDGKPWSQELKNHYGYLRGTVGKDKDHLDVFIGREPTSDQVFVVNQKKNPDRPLTENNFDEHKIMVGFESKDAARDGYLSNYQKGWKGLGSISATTVSGLKDWIKSGKTKTIFEPDGFASKVAMAKDIAKRVAKELPGAPEIRVAGTLKQLPKSVRRSLVGFDKTAAQNIAGLFVPRPEGSQVYLIAENLESSKHAYSVAMHEVVGHYGLRGVLADKYVSTMESIEKSFPREVRAAAKLNSLNMADPQQRLLAAEEFVAYSAQLVLSGSKISKKRMTMLQRVVDLLRQALERIGVVKGSFRVNDLLRLIRKARMYVANPMAAESATPVSAMFSKVDHSLGFYSGLEAAARSLKQEKGSAQQMLAMIKKTPGVKQEELDWVGLPEYLAARKAVTKQQIVDFIEANGVQVEEKVLVEDFKPLNIHEQAELLDLQNKDIDSLEGFQLERRLELTRRKNDELNGGQAQFAAHTLPGGENYREVLITLPVTGTGPASQGAIDSLNAALARKSLAPLDEEQVAVLSRPTSEAFEMLDDFESRLGVDVADARADMAGVATGNATSSMFTSGHFDQPNVLAHLRLNDRTGPNGEKILFIEEVQSDWHQKGRREGYAIAPRYKVVSFDGGDVLKQGGIGMAVYDTEKEAQSYADTQKHWSVKKITGKGIPDAPFKGNAWAELSMKRALRMAVDGGYDQLAWTTGEQQADRYDLSKKIESIAYIPEIKMLRAYDLSGETVIEEIVKPEQLPDYIGKEAADRLLASKAQETGYGKQFHRIEGTELKVGGEGMKSFYDKILRNIVSKVARKLDKGAQIGSQKLVPGEDFVFPATEVHSVTITDEMGIKMMGGQPLFHVNEAKGRREAINEGDIFDDGFGINEGSKVSRGWNYLVFKAQDKFIDLLRLQQGIEAQTEARIPDQLDTYLQEELFHGRVKHRVDEYNEQHVEPLVRSIHESNYNWDEVEWYLYARHAPEANKRLAEINEDPSYNSGMTDEEASTVMEVLKGRGDFSQLEEIAVRVDAMTALNRKSVVEEGLETQETVSAWESLYDYYVPLKGWKDGPQETRFPRKGKGFDTGGKLTKQRLGRKSKAANILANIVAQYQSTIVMGEKAKVGRTLLDMVKEYPSPSLWSANKVEMKRYLDKTTGLVTTGVDPTYKLRDNVLRVKVDGQDYHITFNPNNEAAMRIASSMKNLGAEQINRMISALLSLNRFLSAVNTSFNPEFIITNLTRDLQTAMINLNATDANKMKMAILKDTFKAHRGIRRFLKLPSFKNKESADYWRGQFEEYRKLGGQVGWLDNYKDVQDLEASLYRQMHDRTAGMVSFSTLRKMGHYIEMENQAIENAVRLSSFVHAKNAGMSPSRAASLAKNLTVNFNRKGDIGTQMNALYLFANASAQGIAIILKSAKSPKVRKVMYGIVAFAAALEIMNRMLAGDDDDGENRYDKIPAWVKERNMIIMLPEQYQPKDPKSFEDYYITVPLPYGYNMLHVVGQKIGGIVDYAGIGNKREWSPMEDATEILSAALGSFNPIGTGPTPLQTVIPTALTPLVQVSENVAWHGGPVIPPQNPWDPSPAPESQQYFRSVSAHAKALAEFLNKLGGGTKASPAKVKFMDISPETIELWENFLTGGAGRFVSNMVEIGVMAKESKVDVRKVPFVRRFVGMTDERAVSDRFYQHVEEISYAVQEIKVAGEQVGMAATKEDRADAMAVRARTVEQYRADAALESTLNLIRQEIAALNVDRKAVLNSRRSDEWKEEKVEQIEIKKAELMNKFNKKYNEVIQRRREEMENARISPQMSGKERLAAAREFNRAGYPAMTTLVKSLPTNPDRDFLEKLNA